MMGFAPENMTPVPREMDEHVELRVRALIAPIVKNSSGRVTMDQILADHRGAQCQIWAIWRDGEISSVGITRIIRYPSGRRILRLDHGGGTLEDAVMIMPEVERLARHLAVDAMRIEGRVGWQRVFPGWHEVSRVIEKEIPRHGDH